MYRERNINCLTGIGQAYANSLNIRHYVLQLFRRNFKILLSNHAVYSFTVSITALVEILPARKKHLRSKKMTHFAFHTKTQLLNRFNNIGCLGIFYKVHTTRFIHYMATFFSTVKLTLK